MSVISPGLKRRLAPEIKTFVFLLAAFSMYHAVGVLFSSYVGVALSLIGLFLHFVFYFSLAAVLAAGAAIISRLSRAEIGFKPSYKFDLFLIIAAFLGVVFIGIDRYFYRGIDVFGLSFAEIRALMNSERADTGVSSIFSVIGNLSQVTYLLVAPRLVFYWEEYVSHSFAKLRLILILLAACLFLSSYLLGGRTLLLLFVFVCAGATLVRVFFRRTMIPKKVPVVWVSLAGAGVLLMSLGVFWVRSQVFGGVESADYLERLLEHVHPYSLEFSGIGLRHAGFYGDLLNYALCVLAYIFHQLWVFDAVVSFVSLKISEGSALLLGLKALAPSLVGGPPVSEVFRGLFFSAPAAFYYDLNILGIFVGSSFLSISYVLALVVFAKSGYSFAIFFPSFIAAAILMAPVAFILIMPYAIILGAVSLLVLVFLSFFRALTRPVESDVDGGR